MDCYSSWQTKITKRNSVIGCPKSPIEVNKIVMAEELQGQSPRLDGSTGDLLSKVEREEKYAITWSNSKE